MRKFFLNRTRTSCNEVKLKMHIFDEKQYPFFCSLISIFKYLQIGLKSKLTLNYQYL